MHNQLIKSQNNTNRMQQTTNVKLFVSKLVSKEKQLNKSRYRFKGV